MKRSMITTCIFTLLLTFSSCKEASRFENSSVISRDDFSKIRELTGIDVQFEDEVLRPTGLRVFEDLLFTINTREKQMIHIYDLKSKQKIGERISMGQGPTEMVDPSIVKIDDVSIHLYDMVTSKLLEFSTKDFIENSNPQPLRTVKIEKPTAGDVYRIGDQWVGAGFNPSSQFVLFDANGRATQEVGAYPVSDIAFSDQEKIEAYRFSFTTNAKDKILICYNWTDLIDVLDKDGKLEKRMHGPSHFISEFKERNEGGMRGASPVKDKTRDAFYSPISVGDDFFVLYNGRAEHEEGYSILANEVFTFDKNGNPKDIYTLDQGVFAIAVDSKNKTLYGICNTPEFHIVAYEYK